jgi:hypothetical protein
MTCALEVVNYSPAKMGESSSETGSTLLVLRPCPQLSRPERRFTSGRQQQRRAIVLLSLFRVTGWACVVALIVLSLVPGNERPHTGGLPGQIEHVIAYCGTAALLGLGYPTAKARFGMVAMLALLAAVLEMAQLWVPDRHTRFIDFAASTAGACLGILAMAVVDRLGLADLGHNSICWLQARRRRQ